MNDAMLEALSDAIEQVDPAVSDLTQAAIKVADAYQRSLKRIVLLEAALKPFAEFSRLQSERRGSEWRTNSSQMTLGTRRDPNAIGASELRNAQSVLEGK